MSADLLKRLEAVAARLEAYAGSLKPRGGGGDSKGGDSAAVGAYDAYYSSVVQPFIDNIRKVKETNTIADWTETAFKHQRVVIAAASQCKKPSQDALMNFVGPIATVISTADAKVDNRSAFFNQQKAFAEGIQALQWIVTPSASKPIVQGGVEAADFYLIKILTLAKNKSGEEQQNLRNYASGFKDVLSKLAEFAHENFKLGLDWNPKGGDLASFSAGGGGGGDAAGEDMGGAPAPPPGPPPSIEELGGSAEPPKAAGAPGMGAVFADINKGEGVTSGLKKVDKSMKTKNMKDVPVLVPKEKKAAGGKQFKAAHEEKKPPKLELSKGTWFVEWYEDQTLEIKDVEIKQSVYITKCRGCQIVIPDKCKSIAVDGCFKTTITFKSVVSTFEMFNSQRCVADVTDSVPSVAIDKSQGCQIHLSRSALKEPPQVITSNISETNIQCPGAKDEDDPIEIPVPEQFQTTIKVNPSGSKQLYGLNTTPVTHGD
jgi:adenylyl cyclase-associated protein